MKIKPHFKSKDNKNTLYLVSTPIGNLKDITIRALEILKQSEFILCEDTRISKNLLNKYEIKYMLESEQSKTDRLIDIMGKDRHHIDDLYSQIQEHKQTIAALGATNRKLKIENDKYKQIEKATYEKDMLTALGERDN